MNTSIGKAGGEQDIAPLTCGVHKRCARHVDKRVDKHTIARRIHHLTHCPIDRQYSQCNFKNMQFRNRTSYRKNFSGVSLQEGKKRSVSLQTTTSEPQRVMSRRLGLEIHRCWKVLLNNKTGVRLLAPTQRKTQRHPLLLT